MKGFIRVIKALSDPTRVKIMKDLEKRTMCVCELQTAIGAAPSTTNNHLKTLEDAGLVASHKDGRWANYTSQPAGRARMPLRCWATCATG
jgi:ArsR family transcriptional regulator, arsenate/arsenite/antimonite-responsive transcriptional repressor